MPIRSEWRLAREGITPDTLGSLIKRTALNPVITLPLFLLARYTSAGASLASQHGSGFRWLKSALALGVLSQLSGWFDDAVTNNFTNDTYDWSKEVVVVTGGSDGIGKAVVEMLAEQGIKVAVLDVQPLTYAAPPTVSYFACDLASPSSISAACAAIRSSLGDPTVLINNAGICKGKTILDTTEADLRLTFGVNSFSHYFLAHQLLPSMVANNHGMIVTVASLAAYVCAPSMVDYASSKAAALSFHEGLSAELARTYNAHKVRTVAICQGYTRTKLFEGFEGRALYPETVAEAIVKSVLKGKSAHIVLPDTAWLVAPRLRGYPIWFQYAIRKRLASLMSKWQGRQITQPSAEKEVEGSTVLVNEEKEN